MIRNLLIRGMIAGICAGLLGFGFAKIFGEPSVDRAIAFETQMAHMRGEADEPELVSRGTQAGFGLLTGVTVYGTALGGLFALVFAVSYGRIGALRARGTAALLALFAFITIAIVPFLKYPPNPPSIGNPDTIGMRTGLFFSMVVLSIIVAVFAVRLQRRLRLTHGDLDAALIAVAIYVVLMALALFALPSIDEVPAGFSASLLWKFRVTAIGIQAVIWTTLGLGFGVLAQRQLEPAVSRRMVGA